MTRHRTARLNEQLKREISDILARKVRDPRIGRVLVSDARVTPDLWLARIFIRPLDDDDEVDRILEGLEAASPFIRKELGKLLRIRRIPELRFLHDTTLDSAHRIEAILKDVMPEGDGSDLPAPGAGPVVGGPEPKEGEG